MSAFSTYLPATVGRILLVMFLLAGTILPAAAQAPGWQSAQAVAAVTASGISSVDATAVDAAGNVFVAGSFLDRVVLGGTTLTSLGGYDVFVAKFNPVSNQFVWAQRAGGARNDNSSALVVNGTSVYVAGSFWSATADFGATTLRISGGSQDAFVAKLTDAGSTGSFVWAQRAGGAGLDFADALAVSGTNVYIAGGFETTVDFGATTLSSAGSGDGFVAKLTDAGSTASFVWAQRAGGAAAEHVSALAVSGSSVYVTGNFSSPTAGFGATTLSAPVSLDMFVAKLTDAGSTGSFVWAQRAGGAGLDFANGLAVSGTNVYIAGGFHATADFGAITLSSAGSFDTFVAKLTDAGSTGSFVWAQRAGGVDDEFANALAASGSNVYVAGAFSATAAFGATTLSSAGSGDVFVAKLTDAGSTASFVWAQQASGADSEGAGALAVSGSSVYVAGSFLSPTLGFGPTTLTNPFPGPNVSLGFLATLTDLALMGAAAAPLWSPAQLFPNPARHTATLRLPAGATPAPLALTDAQGRTVRHYPAPTAPEVTLNLRDLPAGLYLLRGAGPMQRLVVE